MPYAAEVSDLEKGNEDAGSMGTGSESDMDKSVGTQLDELDPAAQNAGGLLAGLPSPTMKSTYQSFLEPTFIEQSPVRNEFETGHALFAFDEDVDFVGDIDLDEDKVGRSVHFELGKIANYQVQDDFGLDAEDGKADEVPLSTSSTVGSLPIEIKWPARRDPRG